MNNANNIILVGAGRYGAEALNFFGFRNVYCFVDSYKAGKMHYGKMVISFEELAQIHARYKIIIALSPNNVKTIKQISDRLIEYRISYSLYFDYYADYADTAMSNDKFLKWKDVYSGGRCFLIGNGPSLRMDDLDKLKSSNAYSMGCNFINKAFDKTEWRPNFYCCSEDSAILLNKDFIFNSPLDAKFIANCPREIIRELFNDLPEDVCVFFRAMSSNAITKDPTKILYSGGSVMCSMLSIALFMGFKEIILLGVDNTAPPTVFTHNFSNANGHFYKENVDELEERKQIMSSWALDNDFELYANQLNATYSLIKEHAKKQSANIFNATRGGKLEVFERVDFDSLF